MEILGFICFVVSVIFWVGALGLANENRRLRARVEQLSRYVEQAVDAFEEIEALSSEAISQPELVTAAHEQVVQRVATVPAPRPSDLIGPFEDRPRPVDLDVDDDGHAG